jgi:DEAD/DEAH box helicase domain-containing protein
VGGITYLRHPQLGRASIFLYDGHHGGVGFVAHLFERAESLLETTLELVEGCACEAGCPACVHSPKCGSGNRPIDKAAAILALRLLLAREPLPALPAAALEASAPQAPVALADAPPPPRVLVFDLETQRSAEEVGGWHNAHLMRLALAVVYDVAAGRFESYAEAEVEALLVRLRAAELVVGFNVRRFDYLVLRGYTDEDLESIPTFDVLEALHARLGFRVSLGHLASETLGESKSADGLQALAWWREGRRDAVEEYCRRDVALLRDLFAHALSEGHLMMRTKGGERVRVPTRWSLPELIEHARAGGGSRVRARARRAS